jgi:hypothetical protein
MSPLRTLVRRVLLAWLIAVQSGGLVAATRAFAAPAGGDPVAPLPMAHISRMPLVDQAYLDAFTILRDSNSCSQFYGGPGPATEVLNQLAGSLRPFTSPDRTVGVRMFGPVTNFTNRSTNVSYRLFEHAQLNTLGPFYRQRVFPGEPSVPHVGSFAPNTREARVLIFLHELGHLMQGAKGGWLLEDDGNSRYQSEKNTDLVLTRCGEQIRGLSRRK